MKKKILIVLFLMMLFVGVKNVSAAIGVTCEYGDYSVTFTAPSAPESAEGKVQYLIKNGYARWEQTGLIVNYYSSGSDINDTDWDNFQLLVKKGDVSACAKYAYFYESTVKSYVCVSRKPIEDPAEVGLKQLHNGPLTAAYCVGCATTPKDYEEQYTNYDAGDDRYCGDNVKLPAFLPNIVSKLYILIQILVPVVLVILGTMDLLKGITAGKDDEIRKAQQAFFKRLIAAVLVFFVFAAVKLTLSLTTKKSKNLLNCVDCIIRNKCSGDKTTCSSLGFSFTMTETGYIYPESLSFSGLEIERVESPFRSPSECLTANKNDYSTEYDASTKTFRIVKAFKYIDCTLDGYEFQLRNDGHIPAASVYGNGIDEAWDTKSDYNDGSKCPSSSQYKASVTSDGVFVITKK